MTCRRHPFRAGPHHCSGAVPPSTCPTQAAASRREPGRPVPRPRPRPLHPRSGRRGGDSAAAKDCAARGSRARRGPLLGRQDPEYAAPGARGLAALGLVREQEWVPAAPFPTLPIGGDREQRTPLPRHPVQATGRERAWNPRPPFGWLAALG